MRIRHAKREELNRLESKTLDAKFTTTVREGLNCSPFEAQAVLDVVREHADEWARRTPRSPARCSHIGF